MHWKISQFRIKRILRVQTTKWLSLFGYYSLNFANGDSSGAGSAISTPGNIAADYGRTSFDVKSRMLLSGSITLPKYIQISPFVIGQSGNPYNITTGSDVNNDTFFNDRAILTTLVPTATNGVKTIPGCGTFAQPGTAGAGTTVVPINYCTGPALFTFNVRATKTWGFGPSRAPANPQGQGRGQGQGQPGGMPGAPPPSGGGRAGAAPGGGAGGRGGGAGGGGGGGTNTGKRYNLTVGFQAQNLFNNKDLSTPQGSLTSPYFGTSTQLSGGAYTTSSAVRRFTLQTSFTF